MKKVYGLALVSIVYLISAEVSQAQGYRFDKNRTAAVLREPNQQFGYGSNLPVSYSLRRWAPAPGLQDGSSCVGWAMSYAAMSILYNRALNITDKHLKSVLAFDPVFTYALAKTDPHPNCDDGVYFPDAIVQMLKYGCKRLIMPPLYLDCKESVFEYSDAFSSAFVPTEVYDVDLAKASNAAERIRVVKSFIASGIPLPFGMEATPSLMGDGNSNPLVGGLWRPNSSDENLGGHAMCVIGYDDNRFGGAFEIMNSWGSTYGENGFFWIRYTDFISRVSELVYIDPIEIPTSNCKIGNCETGYSVVKLPDGTRYEGMMMNAVPQGYGVYVWPDKDFYAGGWVNGKREGKGLFFTTGRIFECNYAEGELLSSEPAGFAANVSNAKTDQVRNHLSKRNEVIETDIPADIRGKLIQLEVRSTWEK